MKLYEAKFPVKIYCECSDESTYITVDHLDGMYSFGQTEKGGIIHLGASTELNPFLDGYEIITEE